MFIENALEKVVQGEFYRIHNRMGQQAHKNSANHWDRSKVVPNFRNSAIGRANHTCRTGHSDDSALQGDWDAKKNMWHWAHTKNRPAQCIVLHRRLSPHSPVGSYSGWFLPNSKDNLLELGSSFYIWKRVWQAYQAISSWIIINRPKYIKKGNPQQLWALRMISTYWATRYYKA